MSDDPSHPLPDSTPAAPERPEDPHRDRLDAALADRYAIERELGEGGMATVYLAEDLKHSRKVAIKVLKPELAAVVGAERFLAEIETTANLQHPHILPLFDSGEADGFLYYVMPYVEGESLREKLDREKQLPVDEAVAIAAKVAGALETAHEQGIVHRDVKPANILLSRGEPLVADFGIALAVGAAGGNRLTETGLSVGTPYYMSPEQATGDQHVGPAADQYALGCVLYEMLTGDPPYVGSTAQAVLGKIIQGTPAPTREVRTSIPPNVDGAVLRALERLPADRFGSTAAFAAALADPAFRYGESESAVGVRSGWTPLTTGFALVALLFAGLAAWALVRPQAPEPVSRYFVDFPEGQQITRAEDQQRVAITRDGRRFVYIGPGPGGEGSQLWIRHRDALDAAPIPGTENAFNPALSPDEAEIAFTVLGDRGNELRAIPVEGGPSRLLSDSVVDWGGVSWGYDGYVYHDAHLEGDGFARVAETGGDPERVTVPADGETFHSNPHALPGGRGVLFYAAGVDSVGVVDLESGEYHFLVAGFAAAYMATGYLLWVDPGGTMMAAPFDEERLELTGTAVPLVEGMAYGTWGGWNVAASDEGTLLYLLEGGDRSPGSLTWVDRDGATSSLDPPWVADFRRGLALSPNGSRIAATIQEDGASHIWVRPSDAGPPVRVTFEGWNGRPRWTPDGERLLYGRTTARGVVVGDLVLRDPDAPGRGEVLLEDIDPTYDISSDGRWLLFSREWRPYAQPLDEDYRPAGEPVQLDFGEGVPELDGGQVRDMALSPDGRWLAYFTMISGGPQIEVRPFPEVDDGRWPLAYGAVSPVWGPEGRELFFRNLPLGRAVEGAGIGALPVSAGSTFAVGEPELLFPLPPGTDASFAVAPDGAVLTSGGDPDDADRLVVVEGFFQVLDERFGR